MSERVTERKVKKSTKLGVAFRVATTFGILGGGNAALAAEAQAQQANCPSGINVLGPTNETFTVIAQNPQTKEILDSKTISGNGRGQLRWNRPSNAAENGAPAYSGVTFTQAVPDKQTSFIARCGNAADVLFNPVDIVAVRPQIQPTAPRPPEASPTAVATAARPTATKTPEATATRTAVPTATTAPSPSPRPSATPEATATRIAVVPKVEATPAVASNQRLDVTKREEFLWQPLAILAGLLGAGALIGGGLAVAGRTQTADEREREIEAARLRLTGQATQGARTERVEERVERQRPEDQIEVQREDDTTRVRLFVPADIRVHHPVTDVEVDTTVRSRARPTISETEREGGNR